jgi:hypothetical protein
MKNIVFFIALLLTSAFAGNSAMVSQMTSAFVSSFTSIFIPIVVFGAIISIGLSMAQKKPEMLAYGCGTILLLGLILVIVDFIKAHSAFFTIAGIVIVLIVAIVFIIRQSRGEDYPSDVKAFEKEKILNSHDNASYEKTEIKRDSILRQNNSQSEITPAIRDPFHVYPATYDGVVRQIPTATEIAGKVGEDEVSKAVWTACQFDGRHYKILRNVYVPVSDGYSEIDVLLLHETGVYVFESKNVSGSVYGDENHPQWQRFKSNSEKNFFSNPVMQNEGHIKALCDFLQLSKYQFRVFSIIVFGLKSKLKAVPENTSFMSIYEVYNLETELVKKMMAEKVFYNAETIDLWCKKLLPCTLLTEDQKKAHHEKIAQKFHKIS